MRRRLDRANSGVLVLQVGLRLATGTPLLYLAHVFDELLSVAAVLMNFVVGVLILRGLHCELEQGGVVWRLVCTLVDSIEKASGLAALMSADLKLVQRQTTLRDASPLRSFLLMMRLLLLFEE